MMLVGHLLDHVPDHELDHMIIGLVIKTLQNVYYCEFCVKFWLESFFVKNRLLSAIDPNSQSQLT